MLSDLVIIAIVLAIITAMFYGVSESLGLAGQPRTDCPVSARAFPAGPDDPVTVQVEPLSEKRLISLLRMAEDD